MRGMTDPVAYYERRSRRLFGQAGAETCYSIGGRWKVYGPCALCASCTRRCRGIAGSNLGEVKYCAKYLENTV